MKKNNIFIVGSRIVFAVLLLLIWRCLYPATLTHVEDVAFFACIPDYLHIQFQLPRETLNVVGNFLSQFYQSPLSGALIQMLMVVIVLVSTDIIVWRLKHRTDLLWISFIPASLLALQQSGRVDVAYSLRWDVVAIIVAIAALIIPFGKLRGNEKTGISKKANLANIILTSVAIIVVGCCLSFSHQRQDYELSMKLEKWAGENKWSNILDTTYPKRYQLNRVEMAYSLLALSERGRLPSKLFSYPVNGIEDLYNPEDNNPVQCRFNSFFCWNIGLPNEAIRYAFEEGQGEEAGISFGSTRRMVDWLQDRGVDQRQVAYYLNLLSHSTCNDDFVKTRRMRLGMTLDNKEKKDSVWFVPSKSLVLTAAKLYEQDPGNKKALDYLLCGLLLMRMPEEFLATFQQYYTQQEGQQLPRHYEEALVMLISKYPQIEVQYDISGETLDNYKRFIKLFKQGGKAAVMKSYGETYWGYLLRTDAASAKH